MRKSKNKAKQPIVFSFVGSRRNGYTASAQGHSIFTQADTVAELKRNVRDAVICHFGEAKGRAPIRFVRARSKRMHGSAKGEFTVLEGFNDPLPRD